MLNDWKMKKQIQDYNKQLKMKQIQQPPCLLPPATDT